LQRLKAKRLRGYLSLALRERVTCVIAVIHPHQYQPALLLIVNKHLAKKKPLDLIGFFMKL
jgi:hypothetical protein